jgi:hypothetical protein
MELLALWEKMKRRYAVTDNPIEKRLIELVVADPEWHTRFLKQVMDDWIFDMTNVKYGGAFVPVQFPLPKKPAGLLPALCEVIDVGHGQAIDDPRPDEAVPRHGRGEGLVRKGREGQEELR